MTALSSTQTQPSAAHNEATPSLQTARPMQLSDKLLQTGLLPDRLIRWGIRQMLAQKLQEHQRPSIEDEQAKLMAFVSELNQSPLAIETQAANAQHYEVPAAFFQHTLGAHLKYSCALWQPGCVNLDQAEAAMLSLYAKRAELENGQRILELGCGWGSLSLWMAKQFPASQIVTVSNSASQKAFIDAQAQVHGLANLEVITANIIDFEATGHFDRIVSIEMMEHLKNYGLLFERIQRWLTPQGKLFVHIFTHRRFAYHYDDSDASDWLTRHFFSGGTMPSADLFHYFQRHLTLEAQWAVNGTHYEKTANAWLANMDRNRTLVKPILGDIYGSDQANTWWHYWRIFFMACAELWGYQGGNEWFVSHYRFSAK
jgi:cyclopropane-fatty-acyl-phospholipid synthase